MASLKELRLERIKKIEELRSKGINPYPSKSKRTEHIGPIIASFEAHEGKKYILSGRIMSIRTHGALYFADISDATGSIQVYIKQDSLSKTDKDAQTLGFDDLALLDIGDLIDVGGTITKTKRGEISIEASEIFIITKSIRPLPDKVEGLKDPELLTRQRYLDTIMNPEKRWRFQKTAEITFAIREFLNSKGYLEIKTPMLQPVYGGTSATPFKTHVRALDVDFYLSISHELYLKRLITAGFENVYNLVGYFRNEGIDRTHNPEFTMVETMSAFHNYEYNMDLTEEMYKYIGDKVFGKSVFNVKGHQVDFSKKWKRMTMVQAVKEYEKIDFDTISDLKQAHKVLEEIGYKEDKPKSIGECMVVVFEEKVEKHLIEPTFITNHPVEISPLAKSLDSDPRYVERFEIFIGGIEGGDNWSELNDPVELFKRLKKQQENRDGGDEEAHPLDLDFIEMMEHGMPPTTGLGPGIERMAMIFTEADHIDDVIFFPMVRPKPNDDIRKDLYGV